MLYRDLPAEHGGDEKDGDAVGKKPDPSSKTQMAKTVKLRRKAHVVLEHVDVIQDDFWVRRPWILKGELPTLGESMGAEEVRLEWEARRDVET